MRRFALRYVLLLCFTTTIDCLRVDEKAAAHGDVVDVDCIDSHTHAIKRSDTTNAICSLGASVLLVCSALIMKERQLFSHMDECTSWPLYWPV